MERGCSSLDEEQETTTWVYDATDQILGRLSSHVAKVLLSAKREGRDERVVVVNAGQAVISGSRASVLAIYRKKVELNHPRRGPFYPRMSDQILKRTVRGMLPYQKNSTGRAAFRNLRVLQGCPAHLAGDELPDGVQRGDPSGFARPLPERFMRLDDISKSLGAPQRVVSRGEA